MNNCIEINNLNFNQIFKNFNIKFENNKFISVAGPNNCGKTTLIRLISNQIPTKNKIKIKNNLIENYKITDLNKIIKTVIPLEVMFTQKTVEDELLNQLPIGMTYNDRRHELKYITKKLKITKIIKKNIKELTNQEIIKLQLAISLIINPQIVLIDDLNNFFNRIELQEIFDILKEINIEKGITIIAFILNLDYSIKTDYMYLINKSEIVIEGKPFDVLQKDNILNKAGLEVPFMMDLSVKLIDYDLIKDIELDMDRMVNKLWN